ncbi:MAG: hypothetical protein HC913_15895 [Microscillaceae bacterium]|nr:hypothetical protein [Microscillaceae bacterium]
MQVTPSSDKKGLGKLQHKWGLSSNFQVMVVLVVFSLAGSTAVLLRPALFGWLGYTEATSFWLKTFTYLLFLFPAYQVLLLGYGFLLGQFGFFWQKEVKMVAHIRKHLTR